MITRLLLLLPAFLFCILQTRAQAFEPGLLVRSNGDTLRGEIENGFWVEPPAFIRFRPTPDGPTQQFAPRQLCRVSFTGGRLFRYEGLPIDHAAKAKVGSLPYENLPDIRVDSLLAEVLVDGPVSLVRVALFALPVHYLLLSPDRLPLDLSERKYLRQAVDKAWLLTNGNNYRGQLGVYFGQCPAAYSTAQRVPFTAAGLTEVVQAYNTACSPAQKAGRNLLALATPRHLTAFQGGVLGGMRYNRLESYAGSLAGPCVDCQPHPFGGLYAELLQPSRTSAVYGELSLSRFESKGAHRAGYTATGSYAFDRFDYRAWLATARIGVRYFAPMPHEQQLLVGFGFELNKVLAPLVSTPSGQPVNPDREEYFFAVPTLLPNVMMGWRRQRFTLSLDGQMYISSTDDTSSASTLASSNRFAGSLFFGTNFAARLGLSYRLSRNPDAVRSATAAGR